MALDIDPKIADSLPTMVKSSLSKMKAEEQMMFQEQYKKKSKDMALMIVLAVIFPIQLFLLDKTGLGIAFWLTGGGFGIWWVIEWFLTPMRVKEYNESVAIRVMTEMKIMSQ